MLPGTPAESKVPGVEINNLVKLVLELKTNNPYENSL
jgi:hypothetical protein